VSVSSKEFIPSSEHRAHTRRACNSRKKKVCCLFLIECRAVGTKRLGLYQKCDAVQPICDRCSAAGIGHECFYKERAPQKSPTLKDTTIISLDVPQVPSPNLSPTSTTCSLSPSARSPQYAFPGGAAGLQFSVNTVNSSDVASASPLDIDQVNTPIPDTSLDDLNASL
jgi:hypothetical protein